MAITPDCGSGYERSIRPLGPNLYTGLAQQVERHPYKLEAIGSIPIARTSEVELPRSQ